MSRLIEAASTKLDRSCRVPAAAAAAAAAAPADRPASKPPTCKRSSEICKVPAAVSIVHLTKHNYFTFKLGTCVRRTTKAEKEGSQKEEIALTELAPTLGSHVAQACNARRKRDAVTTAVPHSRTALGERGLRLQYSFYSSNRTCLQTHYCCKSYWLSDGLNSDYRDWQLAQHNALQAPVNVVHSVLSTQEGSTRGR